MEKFLKTGKTCKLNEVSRKNNIKNIDNPLAEANSGKNVQITRRNIFELIAGVGLSSVMLQGCTGKDFRQNFDFDEVEAFPPNERGRQYGNAPRLDIKTAKNFLESQDTNIFPIKLTKLFEVVEDPISPLLQPKDEDILTNVINNFLDQPVSQKKLVSLKTGINYLYLKFQLDQTKYELTLIGDQIQINISEKPAIVIRVNDISASRFIQGDKSGQRRMDCLYLADNQTIKSNDQLLRAELNGEEMEIFDSESLLKFLKKNKNVSLYNLDANLFLNNIIKNLDLPTWIMIMKQLPIGSIDVYVKFYSNFVHYEKLDKNWKDEYRDPIQILKSGWGDCDDYVMLNALWAKLNGYRGRVVLVQNIDLDKKHVFIEINNGQHNHIIDIAQVNKDITLDQYLNKLSKSYELIDADYSSF